MPNLSSSTVVTLQEKYRGLAAHASKAALAAADARDQAVLTGSLADKHRARLADVEADRAQRASDAAFMALSKNYAVTDC